MKSWFLAALLALTACGSTENPAQQQVASLQSSDSAPTSTAPPDDKRPRERIDDTPEQAKKVSEPYQKCMGENGIPIGRGKEGPFLSDEEYKQVWPKAWEKCKDKFPLPAWELDKNNPESMDFIHRVVECLRKAGANVEERPAKPGEDQNGYEFVGDNSHIGTGEGMAMGSRCMKESLHK
ncbi:hypothetical protein Lesp02_26430 [Lentzea sp. NBRC 105346]|uniref:hypothetical protein n=1 Tax=Lentzea sp. NBRC 105346 TaxID=3032205 RepID=UPI0025571D7E|nr:hypothetical protein [Lentzea sp. NBRC 105346]GLZ30454.1 hypothetical protein Lesp02_26430 [Lentzea sp. NBRC 105346]